MDGKVSDTVLCEGDNGKPLNQSHFIDYPGVCR
jgi:hypothetical protein